MFIFYFDADFRMNLLKTIALEDGATVPWCVELH